MNTTGFRFELQPKHLGSFELQPSASGFAGADFYFKLWGDLLMKWIFEYSPPFTVPAPDFVVQKLMVFPVRQLLERMAS